MEKNSEEVSNNEVFVVHGRNEQLRNDMFAFLRTLRLHPLEWTEAVTATGKASPYVGEILEAAFERAGAIVVLLTPDDIACLQAPFRKVNDPSYETELTPQARPNVLFEAGMAIGRNQDRTILVEIGELRPFSDVGGRHVIKLNNSPERRKDFIERLKVAGCPVNDGGTDWMSTGDFTVTEYTPSTSSPKAVTTLLLADEAVGILKCFLDADEHGLRASQISHLTRLQAVKVEYFLDQLTEGGFVNERVYMGEASDYYLTKEGRAYLVENNLV